jgi:3-isopropylmalate/(R)-2-methylmalate dehydratase small subunit
MKLKSQAIRLKQDDDVNTDYIISGRYKFQIQDPKELAKYVFNDLEPDFVKRADGRSIIVAGNNFGCGSSREQAPLALKYAGIKAVVAKSFARIFYRNAFNLGIILIETDTDEIADMDELELDLDTGILKNKTKELETKFNPLPEFMEEVIRDGSIVNHFNKNGGFKF